MTFSLFEALKRYAGFSGADEEVLRQLYPKIKGHFGDIVDDFYRHILRDDVTRQILESPGQVDRLKKSLEAWLGELLTGPHDQAYFHGRARIGATHVRVGLPQAYAFAAMSHIRRHLEAAVVEATRESPAFLRAALAALAKILDIDLALIAGSYHEAEKYRDLVELAPDMIHEVDAAGCIVNVNRTEQRRLGYSQQALLGRKLEDLVVAEDRPIVKEHLERVFASGESRSEVRLRTADGGQLDVEILATGVRDPLTGKVLYSRAYVRDISERKRAEDALRKERDAAQRYLDVAGAILCVLDAGGRFELMNKKGCEILGYKEEEVLGRELEALLPARNRVAARGAFERLMAGQVEPATTHESPMVTRSGDERMIEWQDTILKDESGKIIGTLSSGIDVTERRRMEKKLVEQASLARLGELAAMVAHEVKNPLAGISGAIQVIGSQLPASSSTRPIIQEILERLEALNNSLNDLLFFARPRLPHFNPLPLASLLEDTAELLKQDPNLREVAVKVEGADIILNGDAELLKPAFLNLLLNAAQAVNGTGQIRIKVDSASEVCRIAIEDQGPGIPAEVRDKIFEPFFSTKHRGTGLGLPITKRIIEAHGGSISVVCPKGGGTRVIVELPLGPGK